MGILIRILHAKEPGPAFRKDFDRYPNLITNLEKMLCPRNHLKMVLIDGVFAFLGSANLTGSGMGAKNPNKRNFESGIITSDLQIINPMLNQFDEIWMGQLCTKCARKEFCSENFTEN
jgi:phosphatidylserine/phosphatidylglycerophosphate/cardiolipin synthase-like enzyme